MGSYLLHGLETECSYELHGSPLAGARALGRAWIDSCSGPPPPLEAWIHHHHLDDGEIWLSKGKAQGNGGWLVRVRDIAKFHIEPDRSTVHCHPEAGASPRDVAYVTENQLLPLLASLQGLTLIHASAIRAGDRAALFLGTTGRGKSTLALSFTGSGGGRLLTDDCATLIFAPGEGEPAVSVLPSGAVPRLWPDSHAGLFGPDRSGSPGPDYSSKLRVRCTADEQDFGMDPVALGALFVLGEPLPGAARRVCLDPVGPASASLDLVRNGVIFDPGDRQTLTRQFQNVTRIAEVAPAMTLRFAHSFDVLPAVRAAILEALSSRRRPHEDGEAQNS